MLADFGDNPTCYADARARRNYAGTSPITRQSGKKKIVLARYVHNDRLLDALGLQAFAALIASPGAFAALIASQSRYAPRSDAGSNSLLRSPLPCPTTEPGSPSTRSGTPPSPTSRPSTCFTASSRPATSTTTGALGQVTA
uniref:hypothetical protein n=1 Tax=Micromonospora thermarum TaxID=2720024 RepID=UPI0028151517|nr:hypothetical protein [Micromonospora thermarum]